MHEGLELHRGRAPEGWDDAMGRLGAPIFHSTAWADFVVHTEGPEPWFALQRGPSGEPIAAAVAFYRRSRRPLIGGPLSELSLHAHPCAAARTPESIASFLEALERTARGIGCGRIHVGSFASGASPWDPAMGGYEVSNRIEFHYDLAADEEELWRRFRKDQRERIRRLEREGIVFEIGTTLSDVEALAESRRATQGRRAGRGQGYELESEAVLYPALEEFLLRRGVAKLFLARRASETLGAILFAAFRGRAYSVFSGSTPDGYRLGVQSGLFWSAVRAFKSEGYEILNRGGVIGASADPAHPLHGIYRFKERLGTTPVPCRSGVKVVHPLFGLLQRLRSGGKDE